MRQAMHVTWRESGVDAGASTACLAARRTPPRPQCNGEQAKDLTNCPPRPVNTCGTEVREKNVTSNQRRALRLKRAAKEQRARADVAYGRTSRARVQMVRTRPNARPDVPALVHVAAARAITGPVSRTLSSLL